jgi:hypothetical protein
MSVHPDGLSSTGGGPMSVHPDGLSSTGCRVLLCGELNPYGADPEFALYCHPPGCSGARLRLILGLSEDQYLDLHRANLCAGAWSKEQAKARALELLAPDSPWSVMVLLGRKVAEVFEKLDGEPLIAFSSRACRPGMTLVSLPHPSGRNAALWNLRARERAREILRGLVPELPWGLDTSTEGTSL